MRNPFGKKSLQYAGKVKKMSFDDASNFIMLEIPKQGAFFKLVAENQEAKALLYGALLSTFYDDSKNKSKILANDRLKGDISKDKKNIRSIISRYVDVDAAFEIVFYDVP